VAIQIGQVALLGGVCPLLLRALASFGGAHDDLSAGDHTRVEASLVELGWEVLRLWDSEVEKDAAGCAARVAAALERCRARS
jgi:very-short-patch-repair endonuclease